MPIWLPSEMPGIKCQQPIIPFTWVGSVARYTSHSSFPFRRALCMRKLKEKHHQRLPWPDDVKRVDFDTPVLSTVTRRQCFVQSKGIRFKPKVPSFFHLPNRFCSATSAAFSTFFCAFVLVRFGQVLCLARQGDTLSQSERSENGVDMKSRCQCLKVV